MKINPEIVAYTLTSYNRGISTIIYNLRIKIMGSKTTKTMIINIIWMNYTNKSSRKSFIRITTTKATRTI